MCKSARRTHGTAARSVPVAEMLASVAPHTLTPVHVSSAYNDPTYCLFPGDQSRESCGTWQLPQMSPYDPLQILTIPRKSLQFLPILFLIGPYK